MTVLERAAAWVEEGRRLPMDDKINEVWRCPICAETSKTRQVIVECIDGHREDLLAALRELQAVPEGWDISRKSGKHVLIIRKTGVAQWQLFDRDPGYHDTPHAGGPWSTREKAIAAAQEAAP